MKDLLFKLAFLCILFILIPFILLKLFHTQKINFGEKIKVYNVSDDKVYNLYTEEYLISVVAAEMPSVFETEALKAQAVAARTYSMQKYNKSDVSHNGADICTNFAHCQAYCSYNEMQDKWGNDFKKNYNKIKSAVESTRGEYLCYDGTPALTVFHSCSDGKTENAHDVWGGDIPYLVSVDSFGDVQKSDYITEVSFSKNDFINLLNEKYNLNFENASNTNLIGEIALTEGGNVDYVIVGGKPVKGKDIRSALSLKSASFEIAEDAEKIKFKVFGSGHGVGMSQYGANAMAKEGKSYTEILSHYYPGTSMDNMYE